MCGVWYDSNEFRHHPSSKKKPISIAQQSAFLSSQLFALFPVMAF